MNTSKVFGWVSNLEAEGYIKRYTAIVDHKKIDKGPIAYTQVTIKEHSQESLTAFQLEAVKLKEVTECYHITGDFDFLLRIAIRDMCEYNEVLMKKLSMLPDAGKMQRFLCDISSEKCDGLPAHGSTRVFCFF